MRTYEVTYHDPMSGKDHEALEVPMEDIASYLARPHAGTSADDRTIKAQLYADGAPEWTRNAPGYLDGDRWGLIGPELPDSEPAI